MSNPSSPKGAVNVGHSQLLQSPTSAEGVVHTTKEKSLLEARRKFNSCLESDVLDYLHYHPSQLEDCVTTLHRLFSNIIEHPEDQKYRRVSRWIPAGYLWSSISTVIIHTQAEFMHGIPLPTRTSQPLSTASCILLAIVLGSTLHTYLRDCMSCTHSAAICSQHHQQLLQRLHMHVLALLRCTCAADQSSQQSISQAHSQHQACGGTAAASRMATSSKRVCMPSTLALQHQLLDISTEQQLQLDKLSCVSHKELVSPESLENLAGMLVHTECYDAMAYTCVLYPNCLDLATLLSNSTISLPRCSQYCLLYWQVVDMEKSWIWEYDAGSHEFRSDTAQ